MLSKLIKMTVAETPLEEFKIALGDILNVMDLDGDGKLDRKECLTVFTSAVKKSMN